MFSCRRIGGGPGIANFGILSSGIHSMKFSILKASQQSNVKRVVSLLNTLASIRIHSLLQHSVVINHYVKQLNDPPVILAFPTFPNYLKSKALLGVKRLIYLQTKMLKTQFSTFSFPGIFPLIRQIIRNAASCSI